MAKVNYVKNVDELSEFARQDYQLTIAERLAPKEGAAFFGKLTKTPFSISGRIQESNAIWDIKEILGSHVSANLQQDPFYDQWIADMANISKLFCDTQGTDAIGFWLGSERGCRRYHVDYVPMRLLVTYAGKGTEWLPDEAADRQAFKEGRPNDEILKDNSALRFLNPWDIAIFKGGPKGLLHRTPDAALKNPSVLMRLDHPSFWEKVMKHQLKAAE